MGYGDKQIKDLEKTINACKCDTVIIATPIDLSRIIKITKPYSKINYELQEIGFPTIKTVLDDFFKKKKK
jgi:predicted GTPase